MAPTQLIYIGVRGGGGGGLQPPRIFQALEKIFGQEKETSAPPAPPPEQNWSRRPILIYTEYANG